MIVQPNRNAFAGISALENIPQWSGAGKFSPIEVPRLLLAHLGDPQDKTPSLHVGGTNGKGSVCAFLAAMIRASGQRVGQFASPHLTHVTERCMLDGAPVAVAEFDYAISRVLAAADELELELSYFVVSFVATMLVFADRELDVAVVEVGLGGVFDATNLITKPIASVITSISLDHMHILGQTLEEIALNKAGIFKPMVPVFVGKVGVEAREVFQRQAKSLGVPLEFLGEHFTVDQQIRECALENPLLSAAHQQLNASLAKRVAKLLGLSDTAIQKGLLQARWPGRNELFFVEKREAACNEFAKVSLVLDACHNQDGVRALVDFVKLRLDSDARVGQVVIVLGILKRKNWPQMLAEFAAFGADLHRAGIVTKWLACGFQSGTALGIESYQEVLPGVEYFDDVEAAIGAACGLANNESLIVLSGSIHFVGEARGVLTEEAFSSISE